MLKLGIIEVGESDYMSPMILVEIAGKEPRPCIDYRKLNGIIRTEYFPLPNIEERVEKDDIDYYILQLDGVLPHGQRSRLPRWTFPSPVDWTSRRQQRTTYPKAT
ncbi:retrovirus-related Pol polyprotein from transposon 297 [Trichonephila clavipes]|nr:retrovirus-related Pol polyprotein from transposon 297 [Trichonephila clavipes]